LILVDPGVDVVDASIAARCDAMLAQGWVAEVENLRARGYAPSLKSMQTLGYRQINAALSGDLPHQEAPKQIVALTRAYARRQRTYFRHQFTDETTVEVTAKDVSPGEVQTLVQRCSDFLSGETP
jgi:tRNA dimethylallyltransferase